MEAMENAIAEAQLEYAYEEPKADLPPCSCYNQVAGSGYYDNKVNIRQIAFGDALRFLGDNDSKVADLNQVLEIAKRLETYYLEGKTLADTVK